MSDRLAASLTADLALFRDRLSDILLITRKNDPFQGKYALPGGFVNPGETFYEAAQRELEEETGVYMPFLDRVWVYDEPDRDPRGRVITALYTAKFPLGEEPEVMAGDDAATVQWVDVESLKRDDMAFDHFTLMNDALGKWRASATRQR